DLVQDATRDPQLIAARMWDPVDDDGRALNPIATPEWKQPSLASVYALGKYVQERQTLIMTQAYGMEGTCLRLFNVYGPGQALSNPYTGVLAIFSSRLSNGQRPLIFEDGEQRRDFVHVDDVARAIARALGRDDIEPEITGKARVGDIRHCFCDGSKAADVLGFRAQKDFAEGLAELAEWVASQTADDHVDEARAELEIRGLVA